MQTDERSTPEEGPIIMAKATRAKAQEAEPKRPRGRPPKQEGRTVFGQYLVRNELNFEEVAAKLGVSRVYVSMMASGLKYPSADLMFEIEEWSKGEVTMQSWFTGEVSQ